MEAQLLRLPWELVLNVMTCFLPANPTTLIPASDQASQLLLSFSVVSRATQDFAIRKLQQHCIVLDSEDRLRRFLLCLEMSRESSFGLPSVFQNIHTMYLAPFGSIMDNLPIAAWVRDVFGYTCGKLKRLIVDMPFGSLPPWNDHLNVGPVLLQGFERLVNLEEFVCTRDAARLEVRDDGGGEGLKSLLYRWPKIRRLGLNRPSCDTDFWKCVADMPHLEQAIFTSPLGIVGEGIGFREIYLQHARPTSAVTVVLADVRRYIIDQDEEPARSNDAALDADDERLQLMAYRISNLNRKRTFLDSACEWLMGMALEGELWDVKGKRITRAPQLVVAHPQIAELE